MITITAYGMPAPKGSRSFKGFRANGSAKLVESSKNAKPWAEAVKFAALEQKPRGHVPWDGPVQIAVTFTVRKPKSAPKRRRTWPITRSSGDLDKLGRCTLDALADAGVFGDDAQVVELHLIKAFPGEEAYTLPTPGAVIAIDQVRPAELGQDGPARAADREFPAHTTPGRPPHTSDAVAAS